MYFYYTCKYNVQLMERDLIRKSTPIWTSNPEVCSINSLLRNPNDVIENT